jgi:hypothetical protein
MQQLGTLAVEGGDHVQSHDITPHAGQRLTATTHLVVLVVAVALMLGGAVMLIADAIGAAIAIPLVAIGIALVAIAEMDKRRGD